MEKHVVKLGLDTLPKMMTEKQAIRYGQKMQDATSKRAKFEVVIFHATQEINGWTGIRINYSRP